jgi:hypothetical protein
VHALDGASEHHNIYEAALIFVFLKPKEAGSPPHSMPSKECSGSGTVALAAAVCVRGSRQERHILLWVD